MWHSSKSTGNHIGGCFSIPHICWLLTLEVKISWLSNNTSVTRVAWSYLLEYTHFSHHTHTHTRAHKPSSRAHDLADIFALNHLTQAPHTDMNVNTADLAGAPPLPNESKRFQIIQLSGPIKIIVPIEEGEDIDEHVNLETCLKTAASCAPADTHHQPQTDRSRLLPTEGDPEDLVPKTNATCATQHDGGDTQRKKCDHSNPDDTLSPS